eukprot:5729623-Prymnesium_polylepis.1
MTRRPRRSRPSTHESYASSDPSSLMLARRKTALRARVMSLKLSDLLRLSSNTVKWLAREVGIQSIVHDCAGPQLNVHIFYGQHLANRTEPSDRMQT